MNTEITVALISAISAFAGIIAKTAIDNKILPFLRKNELKISTIEKALQGQVKLTNILDNIVRSFPECSGALLLQATNGGSIPRMDKPIYSSILLSSNRDIDDGNKIIWEKQIIDESYRTILLDIIQKDKITIYTEQLPKRSLLYDVYTTRNVVMSKVYKIQIIDNKEDQRIIYLSVLFNRPVSIDNSFRNNIRPFINKIRLLYKEMY